MSLPEKIALIRWSYVQPMEKTRVYFAFIWLASSWPDHISHPSNIRARAYFSTSCPLVAMHANCKRRLKGASACIRRHHNSDRSNEKWKENYTCRAHNDWTLDYTPTLTKGTFGKESTSSTRKESTYRS
jgi:hypothetical protein